MSPFLPLVRRAVGVIVAAAGLAAIPLPAADWNAVREQTFSTVWQTIDESYFDPKFGGVSWTAIREKYRPQIEHAADNPALRTLLQSMLGELGKSHFAIIPREAAANDRGGGGRPGTIGAEFTVIGNDVVVARVRPGSSALAAGLKPGDTVLRINDDDLAQIARSLATSGLTPPRRAAYLASFVSTRLRAPIGNKIPLFVAGPEATPRSLLVTTAAIGGTWSEAIGNFPSQRLESTAERGSDGVAYLRFNVFMPELMKPIRALLGKLRPGDGLVIDLRGNPGGLAPMAQAICGWLIQNEFSLGKTVMRQGLVHFVASPQPGAFLGPVAVLTDHGSASTSEILAAALQESKRARIFGSTTAGAALPSVMKLLPTGDLLQFAVGDFVTQKSARLEGRGVTPDEPVAVSPSDLAAGRDPVLEAARRWLQTERRKSPAAPPRRP